MKRYKRLGLSLIGSGFMGRVHTHAWASTRTLTAKIPIEMISCVGDGVDDETRSMELGWNEFVRLEDVLHDPRVDVVDICVPDYLHASTAIACLNAGKHVLCEKPLCTNDTDAKKMLQAARKAMSKGIVSAVGFNYRQIPAVQLAKQIVEEGGLGRLLHGNIAFHQDWLLDPTYPVTWRLDPDKSGPSPAQDLGAHAIDMIRYVTGHHIVRTVAQSGRHQDVRPIATASLGLQTKVGPDSIHVTSDEWVNGTFKTDMNASISFSFSRVAAGQKCRIYFELFGSDGSLAFDFQRMNELRYTSRARAASGEEYSQIVVTEDHHPEARLWWGPGHVLGYENTHITQVRRFIDMILGEDANLASFEDGLRVQQVIESINRSAASNAWEALNSV